MKTDTETKISNQDSKNRKSKKTKSSDDFPPCILPKSYYTEPDIYGSMYCKEGLNHQLGHEHQKDIWNIPVATKLYKRRYCMLFMFSFCSMMNAIPCFMYVVIADIVECYYDVSFDAANWTGMIYMVVFLPFFLPVMYFMEKRGLRSTLLLGALFNLIGSLTQCAALSTDRFYVVMISQTLYGVAQVMIISLPSFISAVWFGAKEVGLACALGVLGNQFGYALGYMVSSFTVTNDCSDKMSITIGFTMIAYFLTAVNCAMLIIILLAFQEKPEMFPSTAQATKQDIEINYSSSLKNLCKNESFVLLLISYGLITGTYFAISLVINEMVLIHFPGKEVDAGWMGAIMVFTGMGGSIFLGSLLDKTHMYKGISLIVFLISFVLMSTYTGLILMEIMWIQYALMALLGFFMTGYLPVGFEFASEITYPEPEAMSASLLNASTQLFSIIEIIIASMLLERYGDFASNVFFSACLLLGIVITAAIKCDLKRTKSSGMKE